MKIFASPYVNLVICVILFAISYAMIPRITVDQGVKIWVRDKTSPDGSTSSHTESYTPKDPVLIFCSVFIISLIYASNHIASIHLPKRD